MAEAASGIRIQKALADAGIASRRAAEILVAAGRVEVNGTPAMIGQKVDPTKDRIRVDGRPLPSRQAGVYLAVAKPAGVTSTVQDRHAERTVLSLLPAGGRDLGRVYPVGRLDRDSEGLLLLTNDGDWAQRVLHPRFGVEREYAFGLIDPLSESQARALLDGVALDEGVARFTTLRPASHTEVQRLESLMGRSRTPLRWYRAVLTQGWRRQVRRMLAAVESPVDRLVRVRIGSLRLEGLRPGEVRPLSAAERDRLAGGERSSRRRPLVVSLDGPAGSGKSSVGAGAARELGYRFCDTGVLYRGLAWLAVDRGVAPDDVDGLLSLVPLLHLVDDGSGGLRRLRVDGEDVTDRLHTEAVDRAVSPVSKHAPVRAALLPVQRALTRGGGIIMAGRDIGSVVLPDADLKLYLEVSAEERASRRAVDRGFAPGSAEERQLLEDIRRRDGIDSSRETAPLRVPEDATIVRGDGRQLEETIGLVAGLVREAEARVNRA
jgi:cytidylate kinase